MCNECSHELKIDMPTGTKRKVQCIPYKIQKFYNIQFIRNSHLKSNYQLNVGNAYLTEFYRLVHRNRCLKNFFSVICVIHHISIIILCFKWAIFSRVLLKTLFFNIIHKKKLGLLGGCKGEYRYVTEPYNVTPLQTVSCIKCCSQKSYEVRKITV